MAIDWGAWEYSGSNGMRVGIEVTWTSPSNGSSGAIATVEIYTQNSGSWSDDQTLNFGGSISGSKSFSNSGAGTGAVLRATKTYNYSYSSGSYGSSPGNKTFTASLSGAFNGITPTNSLTSAIPARPYAVPEPPTNVNVARISDASQKVTWTNNDEAGKPWNTIGVQRDVDGAASWNTIGAPGGSATSYTDTETELGHRYRYRVRAGNNEGLTSYVTSANFVWTTPLAPTITAALTPVTGPPAGQRISWTNNGYPTGEYETVVTAWKNGASQGIVGTVAAGVTQFDHTTANATPYTSTDKWKYSVQHRTTSGVVLTGASSGFTNETAGTTAPPYAPTGLQPNGLTVDPTLAIRLSWVFFPAVGGDTQTAFDLDHREAGATTWTTVSQTTANQFYDLPANTYVTGKSVEWRVRNKGAHATAGPYATPVVFTTAVTPIAPDPIKVPMQMDLFTGRLEAATKAYEQRDFVLRAQSQLLGGGIRAVDASFNISWSARFLAISLGNSDATFPSGHHDILNPWGWSVTNKALTSNVATLTFAVGANGTPPGARIRTGDTITVSGVGAPFDGTFIARSVTTTTVTYDVVNANIGSTAASGAVYCTIVGHGGAANTTPVSSKILLNNWDALYYELPFGWGAGGTARKNGVVKITNTILTSNVATFTLLAPHYFAVGDRVTISGCGAPYDGADRVVTGITATTITVAITNANVGSANPASALATPSGKDTFFGNFHVVNFASDFVVPSNWVLIALKNGDSLNVEWVSGDQMPANYDSTIYNIGGQKIKKFNISGSGSVNTDASGDITVSHGLGVTPTQVVVGPGNINSNSIPTMVHTFTSTTFKVRWRSVSFGAATALPLEGSGVGRGVYFIAIAE